MSATAATLQQLARDATGASDPESALRALSALRNELDGLEPELVRRAISHGASWSQIARSLGVSKQAAHRKHRHLVTTLGRGSERILVTGEARQSVINAREEAGKLGQPAVGTEHLLLGILRCRANRAVVALGALDVTYERAAACLQTTMPGTRSASTAVEAGGTGSRSGVSPHARRILEGSLREALRHGNDHIGVEHLLLALLADSRNGAMQTLEEMRVTPRQVRERLEQVRLAGSGSGSGSGEPDSTSVEATGELVDPAEISPTEVLAS